VTLMSVTKPRHVLYAKRTMLFLLYLMEDDRLGDRLAQSIIDDAIELGVLRELRAVYWVVREFGREAFVTYPVGVRTKFAGSKDPFPERALIRATRRSYADERPHEGLSFPAPLAGYDLAVRCSGLPYRFPMISCERWPWPDAKPQSPPSFLPPTAAMARILRWSKREGRRWQSRAVVLRTSSQVQRRERKGRRRNTSSTKNSPASFVGSCGVHVEEDLHADLESLFF
jgi:hypothetical protein